MGEESIVSVTVNNNPTNYQRVRNWHAEFGAAIGTQPCMLSEDLARSRVALIEEEFREYREALEAGDLVAVADAIGDLLWVVYGAAVNHGLDADVIVKEIARSNGTKIGADGTPVVNRDGKILKGPYYEPPRLAEVLGL